MRNTFERAWVIPNSGKGKPWKLDYDKSKPVYIGDNGFPEYQDGELMNYRLSGSLEDETDDERVLTKSDCDCQLTIFDF